MYTPHTVTVYNVQNEESPETGFSKTETLYITILRGVFLEAAKGVNVRESGLVSADAANLYIPFGVEAVDGITGAPKTYLRPQEFVSASDRSNNWTLSTDGKGGLTYFVLGEFVTDSSTKLLMHDDCYTVTKVDAKDFGSPDMRHWEVGGV